MCPHLEQVTAPAPLLRALERGPDRARRAAPVSSINDAAASSADSISSRRDAPAVVSKTSARTIWQGLRDASRPALARNREGLLRGLQCAGEFPLPEIGAMMPSPVNLLTKPSKRSTPSSQDREEALHNFRPLFRVHLLGEFHRALHVGEEHGHLLALARAGGARADSSRRGAWAWRVRAISRGGHPAGRQRDAATAAEFLSPASTGAPHDGQATASVAPHSVQKRRSGRLSGHRTGSALSGLSRGVRHTTMTANGRKRVRGSVDRVAISRIGRAGRCASLARSKAKKGSPPDEPTTRQGSQARRGRELLGATSLPAGATVIEGAHDAIRERDGGPTVRSNRSMDTRRRVSVGIELPVHPGRAAGAEQDL